MPPEIHTGQTHSLDVAGFPITLPIVANGRVYVAGQGLVVAYGLLTK